MEAFRFFVPDHPKLYESLISQEAMNEMAQTAVEGTANTKQLVVAAAMGDEPAGVALADYNPILNTGLLKLIYVAPGYSQDRVGAGLMAKMLEELKAQGVRLCTCTYTEDASGTPALHKLLTSTGWQGPDPIMLRAWFAPSSFDAPWMHHAYKYPPGYEQFFWKDLPEKDHQELLKRLKQKHFHPALSPFRDPALFEPMNSLGLRKDGHVVGWVVTHRTDPDTVRYSSVYIDRELRDRGIAMKLLADSLLLHAQNLTKFALLEMPYQIVHPSWAVFIKKRLLPLAFRTTRIVQAWKII